MKVGHLPILALSVAAVLAAGSGRAEPDGPDPRVMALARVTAGEASLQTQTADMAGIHAVLQHRAERMGVGYRTAAHWYASKHFDRGRTDRRRWVAWLRRDLRRPQGWPRHLSWSAHRQTWGDMLRMAEQYVEGTLPACEGAEHWGSRADLRRFYEAYPQARVVDCAGPGGSTRNIFLRVSDATDVLSRPAPAVPDEARVGLPLSAPSRSLGLAAVAPRFPLSVALGHSGRLPVSPGCHRPRIGRGCSGDRLSRCSGGRRAVVAGGSPRPSGHPHPSTPPGGET